MVNNPLISTKQTTTHVIRNPGPGLGQAQKYGWVKLFPGIPTHPTTSKNTI
jgi:hypothetical protein